MFHQNIIYLLIFTSNVCFGYKKLSKYSEFQEKIRGGAVFQLAPDDEEVKVKGVVGYQMVVLDRVPFELEKNSDKRKGGDGRITCVKFPDKPQTYNRLSIRVLDHGYGDDELELEEFVVTTCNLNNPRDMFEVKRIGNNKYSITFKDTDNKCYKREVEVIEDELTLTVRRQEPVKQDCPVSNVLFNTQEGRVVPNSWTDSGDLLDLYYVDLPKGSKFPMLGKLEDKQKDTTFITCRSVDSDGQSFKVVNVFYRAIPIDRLFAKACTSFLDYSIRIQSHIIEALSTVYVQYVNTRGVCLRRKYEVRVQLVDGDDSLRRVTVKRTTPSRVICPLLKFNTLVYRAIRNVEKETRKDSNGRM